MKKVIILRKIQAVMRAFTPPFFNHFSFSLNRKKRIIIMRAMRKKLPQYQCFLVKIEKFSRTPFLQTPLMATFETKNNHASAADLLYIRIGSLE